MHWRPAAAAELAGPVAPALPLAVRRLLDAEAAAEPARDIRKRRLS